MRSLVKGYGDTHERGRIKFDKLAALLPRLRAGAIVPPAARGLIKAALADEDGRALTRRSPTSLPTADIARAAAASEIHLMPLAFAARDARSYSQSFVRRTTHALRSRSIRVGLP